MEGYNKKWIEVQSKENCASILYLCNFKVKYISLEILSQLNRVWWPRDYESGSVATK